MSILSQYEPKKVLEYFEELTKIQSGFRLSEEVCRGQKS